MPVTFTIFAAVFFNTLRTKAEPLRKRNTTCHKTCTHMNPGSVVTEHILAKAGVPLWREEWRKKGK